MGAGDSDATRVGDVPASASQGSLFGVASKDRVDGVGHTELGVHVALSPSDCGLWRDKVRGEEPAERRQAYRSPEESLLSSQSLSVGHVRTGDLLMSLVC